jgi:hypothetical protein
MAGHTNFSELSKTLDQSPNAKARRAAIRAEIDRKVASHPQRKANRPKS